MCGGTLKVALMANLYQLVLKYIAKNRLTHVIILDIWFTPRRDFFLILSRFMPKVNTVCSCALVHLKQIQDECPTVANDHLILIEVIYFGFSFPEN